MCMIISMNVSAAIACDAWFVEWSHMAPILFVAAANSKNCPTRPKPTWRATIHQPSPSPPRSPDKNLIFPGGCGGKRQRWGSGHQCAVHLLLAMRIEDKSLECLQDIIYYD